MADHRPGLPSLNEARAERKRQIATGRAKVGGFPPHLVLWALVILGTAGVLYYRKSQSELEQARNALMAKQRAVAALLGPKLLPIRDKVESAAKELSAEPFPGDFVAPGQDLEKLAETPSIYLRLRIEEASDVDKLRKAAADSLRDGFTSCLYRDPRAAAPAAGATCRISADCQAGELCTEFNVCQRPTQPFNMRLLYRALHVLSSKWTDEVHQARNELAIDAYDGGLESVTRVDVPAAIEVFQRAKLVTLVVDEAPQGGLPPAMATDETEAERLQRTEHMARVGIWDLKSGQLLLRMRTEAVGQLRDVGRPASQEPAAVAARQRQANSCGLALSVKQKIAATGAQGAVPAGATSETTPPAPGTPAPAPAPVPAKP